METTDNTDGDKLSCMKCDSFILELNEDGMCNECSEFERSERRKWRS